MLGKLLFILAVIALLIILVGVNWDNRSTVSFGIYEFPDVPIIIVIGISFLLGSLFSIPYAIRNISELKKKQAFADEKESIPNNGHKTKAKKTKRNRAPVPDVPVDESHPQ